jgi:outer membrane protein assembly factor BamB
VPVGDKVFTLSETSSLICVDAKTGKMLWQRDVDPNDALPAAQKGSYKPKGPHHRGEGMATPTPVSDGQRVYAVFNCGVCAAYDLDGNRQWIVPAIAPLLPAGGITSSPVLADGKLVLYARADLLALDPATGKDLWRINLDKTWASSTRMDRPSGVFASPIVGKMDRTTFVIVPNGGAVTPDGKELASKLFIFWHPSPVLQDGIAYCLSGPNARPNPHFNSALRLKLSGGSLTVEKLWSAEVPAFGARPHDFGSSPVLYQGLVCVVEQTGVLLAYDQASGQLKEKRVLDDKAPPPTGHGSYFSYSSPCVAGEHLFVTHGNGTTVVYQGKDLKEVARNLLEPLEGKKPHEPVRASLAFVGNRIFHRGATALYCIGQKDP